jgi:glutamine synthetase
VGAKFFLFVGVLRYYKGLHILLDAAKGSNYPIIIVGAGPIETSLKRQARKHGLDHVHFLGAVSDQDKVALLSLCYAVVFPSHLRSEAFGISLLEGAMHGKPMISSEIGTGTSFINVHEQTGLVVPPSDPRAFRNAMDKLWNKPERAKSMGFSDFFVGPELEYFYFKDSKGTEVLDEGGYFDLTTLDAGSDLRRETVLALEQLGIRVEYSHHEVGPSQHEIDMRYADALKMADDCMTYRITVKEYAQKYDLHATFMPKPLFGQNGSGMHTHQSLFSSEGNAFFDADDKYFLSDVGKAFIAGQLKHAREMSSVFAQWVNSYKRLVPGYEAPVYVAWSRRNRSALVRVPQHHSGSEQSTRMELRCPDPACNPYITFAVLLHAGLDGIEHGYELPEPMDRNLYHLSPEERRRLGIEQLPETLGEAIEITAESELVLRALGEHAFDRFVEIKRREWEDYRVQVTQWELDRYLPVL